MDREKRKANLKKLQLQSGSSRKLRSGGVALATAKISEFFGTPKKIDNQNNEQPLSVNIEQNNENKPISTIKSVDVKQIAVAPIDLPAQSNANLKSRGSKRTKLKNFLYKNEGEDVQVEAVSAAEHVVPCKKRLSNSDFECSDKQIKKAPKIKSQKTAKRSRAKKQQTIESAFLRNEQLFSEIAAQHCLAENFNPDEMQLALAISKSEADAKGGNTENAVANEEEEVVEIIGIGCHTNEQSDQLNESIRSKLKKYGFRTGSKEDYKGLAAAFLPGANRRTKSKWANKFTPLTLRNSDYQLKKLNDKIANIMQNQLIKSSTTATTKESSDKTATKPTYQLLSNGLRKCANKDAVSQIICYAMTADQIDANSFSKYFVTGLFPISELKAGHLLKSWKTIQGRDLSPKKPNAEAVKKAQRLNKIYRELEKHFQNATNNVTNDDITTAVQTVDTVNVLCEPISEQTITETLNIDNGENELNAMLELINNGADVHEPNTKVSTKDNNNGCGSISNSPLSPSKEPPDKRVKLNNLNHSIHPSNANDVNIIRLKQKSINKPYTANGNQEVEHVNNVLEPSTSTLVNSNMNSINNTVPLLKQQSINKPYKANGQQGIEHIKNVPNSLITTLLDNNMKSFNHSLPTTTQETRSTSPDLFADSDEEIDKSVIATHNGITTFELYSSDEVKTTPSTKELNMSVAMGAFNNSDELPDYIVDLTQTENSNESQYECKGSTKTTQRLDYNSNSQESENKNSNGNLMPIGSLDNDNEVKNTKNAKSLNLVECIEIDDNDDVLLEKLANGAADKTFSNFAAGKQLSNSFHKETVTTTTTARMSINMQFDLITGNDTLFCSLANKYLKPMEYQNYRKKSISMTHLDMPSNSSDRNKISSNSRSVDRNNLSIVNVSQTPTTTRSFTLTDDNDQLNFSAQVASIDLTQDDELAIDLNGAENVSNNLDDADVHDDDSENSDDDEACLILSDDEINYSIWKANKTLHKPDKASNNNEYSFLGNIPEASHSSSKSITHQDVPSNLSLPDLIDDNFRTASFKSSTTNNKNKKQKSFQRIDTDFNLDCDEDEDGDEDVCIIAADLVTPLNDQNAEFNLSKERAAFGIMESRSEPFGLSQLESADVQNNIADSWQDASFLQSPSEQIIVPVKRTSHKFNDLVEAATRTSLAQSKTTTAAHEYNDFDEFDFLIYGKRKLTPSPIPSPSPSPSPTSKPTLPYNHTNRSKTPTGLEQLLTADISYNAYEDTTYNQTLISKTTTSVPHVKPNHNSNSSATNIHTKTTITKTHSLPSSMTNTSTKKDSFLDAAQELTVNGRVYSVRIITTTAAAAKPDYTKQTDAELLKQLYNFGIKPLKRKQAIKMLEYIYNQTHPLLLTPETMEMQQTESQLTSQTQTSNTQNFVHKRNPIGTQTQTRTTSTKQTNQSGQIININTSDENALNEVDKNKAATKPTATINLCLEDSSGAELLKHHDVLVPQLVDPDEVYIFQTNVSKKTPQPLLPLHIAWHNLVCSSIELHEAIVMYETIDLQQIYLFFKSIGYRYDPKDLRNFFDRRCIIFRYDLTPANKANQNNRHVRNPNNARRKQQQKHKQKQRKN